MTDLDAARQRTARSHAEAVLRGMRAMEGTLQAAGFPATSAWWREQIVRWYRSGCRQLVVRCGRRGGKSSSLSRVGVVEALFGHHVIPPGDVGVVAIISTRKSEAKARLATIRTILDALGVEYGPCDDGIQLVGRPIAFRVFTASITGVSGFTSIFVLCDEVSKWLDRDTGANPATTVLASVRPTMATTPNARIVLSSSPMGMLDAHYDAFALGDTHHQVVAHAPTWVANPTVTEAQSRADEPDEHVWLREYAAIPQAEAETSLYSHASIQACTRVAPFNLPPLEGAPLVATIDPATRGHAWTLILARREGDVRRVVLARQWQGTSSAPLSPRRVFEEIAAILEPHGCARVHTDQFAIDPLREIARDAGLFLVDCPWTSSNRQECLEELRDLLLSGRVELPPDVDLVTDLLGVRRVLTRSGVSYALPEQRGRHCDYAPALAMAVHEARWGAVGALPAQTVQEAAGQRKRAYLEGRERERKRLERQRGTLALMRGR